ncbi:MAG: cobalt-precorrin-6A reductase [Ilumatobacteraceae bacterium]|nr:cobalt-precorrin-6A reductase [Ilumatobacteraceae bacterium]
MPGPRVLLLAGTTEARQLARRLVDAGSDVVVSFAGRTSTTASIAGTIRSGGFGGADGLAAFVAAEGIGAVVCATHPYAARMPFNAAAACAALDRPLIRLLRPPWTSVPGDRWVEVDDLDAAAAALVDLGALRVLLTTGRQELAPFAHLAGIEFTVRCIEPPDLRDFAHATAILERGPFTVGSEAALLADRAIDVVVAKNSGGSATEAKLAAARDAGIPVVMVRRPPAPEVPTAATVDEVLDWLAARSMA